MPAARARDALALLLLVVLAAAPLGAREAQDPYLLSLATRAVIAALAAVSLQFIVGFGGLVSFGHAAFLGIGAYAVGILGDAGYGDAWASLPAALAAAGAFAGATGWVAMRTRGVTFIMITLAFGQMAYFVAGALEQYGGDDGMPVDRPSLFGTALPSDRIAFHLGALACLVGAILLSVAIGRSRFGRALGASRENPVRMAALGYDVRFIGLAAYVYAGLGGALAGWLLAVNTEFVSPAFLDWRSSGAMLVAVILGGVGSPLGAALGGAGLVLAQEGLAALTPHWRVVLGPLLVLIAIRRKQAVLF